jgi:hypothetical protein
MNTIRIDILNPKAKISDVLKRLRSKSKLAPTLEEITQEVELVRNKRYAK